MSSMETSGITRVVVALAFVVSFLLYRGCQPGPQPVTLQVMVTPIPVVQAAVQPQNQPVVIEQGAVQPVLALPEPQGVPINRYYVINQARLYCGFITQDLQYTGEPSMQAWWNTLALALKQWHFNDCQR
jgi:hypothetical protein